MDNIIEIRKFKKNYYFFFVKTADISAVLFYVEHLGAVSRDIWRKKE